MKTKIIKIIIAAFVAICAAFIITSAVLLSAKSSSHVEPERYTVQSGATLASISYDLYVKDYIKSRFAFYTYGRLTSVPLRAGIFKISPSMSVNEILTVFESGKFEPILVSIPEGLTVSKIAKLLEEKDVTSAEDFIEASKNTTLLQEYGVPASTFEGYLFPDTYYLDPNMNAETVIRLFVDNFFNRVSQIDGLRDASNEDLFQTLILASIVEREYRVQEEAPLIASVFSNRISENIGLYSCATLEYIITEIQGKPHPEVITYDDIQIDNPYNTYKWAGLPPSPISNPGLIALNAAANPSNTNYFYFRLVDASVGNHIFTTDFDDHIDAGIVYQTKSTQR